MRVSIHAFTHIGQRDENQDRLSVLHSPSGSSCLVVVADGLGGHGGGALAAQTVVETTEQIWRDRGDRIDSEEFLRNLALECHEAVNAAGAESGQEPKTTLAALLIEKERAASVHAGDSRVMQFSGDSLANRTVDHSIGQLNVLRGKITESELATHPDQKKLFSHLGGMSTPDLEFNHWKLADGRRFVVCSDGFWEVFPTEQMLELFESADPKHEAMTRFSKKLATLNNHDNTTAVLVDVGRALSGVWYWVALALLALVGLVVALAPSEGSRNRQTSNGDVATMAPTGRASEGDPMPLADTGGEMRFAMAMQIPTEGPSESGTQTAASENEEPFPSRETTTEGGDTQAQDGESGGTDALGLIDTAVQLDRVATRLDLSLGPNRSVTEVVEGELRRTGQLGIDDILESSARTSELNGTDLVRLQQKHKGIPVYAAEVVATVSAQRVIAVQGRLAPGIDVETAPARGYAETISLAERVLAVDIAPQDQGSTVIFRDQSGRARVAWRGLVFSIRIRVAFCFVFRSTWNDLGQLPNSRMLTTDSPSKGLARIAAAVCVLLFCATDGVCQEGGRDSHSVSLEFDSETVRLLDDASLRDRVTRDLHQRLGLAPSDELEPDPQPRQAVDTSIYTIRQHANSLPVVKLESRLTAALTAQACRRSAAARSRPLQDEPFSRHHVLPSLRRQKTPRLSQVRAFRG